MKTASVSYSRDFRPSPISFWVGPPVSFYIQRTGQNGRPLSPTFCRNPIYTSRMLWAYLEANLNGVDLHFATILELDHLLEVFKRKVLPKGANLIPGFDRPGLPNNHWLSRLPAHSLSFKFRQDVIRFLTSNHKAIVEFRNFYKEFDLQDAHEKMIMERGFVGAGAHQNPYREVPAQGRDGA